MFLAMIVLLLAGFCLPWLAIRWTWQEWRGRL